MGLVGASQLRATPTPAKLAESAVVVYNEKDADSVTLARYYATKRNIPLGNLIGLDCAADREEIGRLEYDRTIATPFRKAMIERGFWEIRTGSATDPGRVAKTRIRFAAVIRGVPLKISRSEDYLGDQKLGPAVLLQHNEASVDSELAVSGLVSKNIAGAMSNPFFRNYASIFDFQDQNLLLVCRLDGPTLIDVKAMIDRTLEAETAGLQGFAYIDARGPVSGGYQEGEDWLLGATNELRKNGVPVIRDEGPDLFPAKYPMRHVAWYLGWYADRPLGPFLQPGFRFNPGAVAVHIHSFSASSVRDPVVGWVAPLIKSGACATAGNVYEPYLAYTSQLNVLTERLLAGFTFAEAAYMSQRVLSWMATYVGDPLYRPCLRFRQNPITASVTTPGPGADWLAYRFGVQRWVGAGRASGEGELRRSIEALNSGIVAEGLGLALVSAADLDGAAAAFADARKRYREPADAVRTAVHETGIVINRQGKEAAAKFAADMANRYAAEPSSAILEMLATSLKTPQEAPATTPATPEPQRKVPAKSGDKSKP
jgi:uncharacterized protein (TIGR03790 family)